LLGVSADDQVNPARNPSQQHVRDRSLQEQSSVVTCCTELAQQNQDAFGSSGEQGGIYAELFLKLQKFSLFAMAELKPTDTHRPMEAAMNGTERRRETPRMTCFGDIHFEPNNGGIVLNVSEGGLCFHSIAPVHKNGPIRFWFSLDRQRIQASGEFVWMDHTQQTGGLRFTSLPAVGREAIRSRTRESMVPMLADEESKPSQLALRSFLALSSTRAGAPRESAGTSALAAVSPSPTGITLWKSWRSFSSGLAVGILASLVVMVVLLFVTNRQQFGRSIIWVGERVAAQPQVQTRGASATALMPSAAPVTPPTPQASVSASIPSSQQNRPVQQASVVLAKPKEVSVETKEPPPEPDTVKSTVTAVSHPKIPSGGRASSAAAVAPAISQPAIDAAANSNLLASKAAPIPPAWPTNDPVNNHVLEAQEPGKEHPSQAPETYFQVGRFKDEGAAKKRTDELGQLGFPATDVQRSRFWSNTYAVLVGPYDEDMDAKAARKSLVSHGYKPQPLERGSREFTFTHTLIINGVRLPVGDCTIRWESYSTQVTVEFVHDKSVVATVDGKWVTQAVRYDRNAFAYIRGTGSLVEIRFAGMTRTLVFGKLI
jgi:SPOR domain/PilZ domain